VDDEDYHWEFVEVTENEGSTGIVTTTNDDTSAAQKTGTPAASHLLLHS